MTAIVLDTNSASNSAGRTGGSTRGVPEIASDWRLRDLLVMAGIGLLLGIARAEAAMDSDVLWSTRYGLDFLNSGHLHRSDIYSWTASGHAWIPSSWGWNVVLGLAYRGVGFLGLWLVGIALAVALALTVGKMAARVGVDPSCLAMVFTILGPIALVVAPRAQTATYLVIVWMLPLLPQVLCGNRSRFVAAFVAVCGLQLLWTNLHNSAPLGPVILVVGGASLLLRPGQSREPISGRWARLVALVAAATACCFASPYGAAPILHILAVRRASVGLISEWDHPGVGNFAQIVGVIAVVGAVVTARLAWRAHRSDTAAVLLLLGLATLSAVRFAPMVVVVALPELALALGRLDVRPHMLRWIAAAGCATLAALGVARAGSFAKLDAGLASPKLVSAVPHGCRLVNDYTIGAALILARPDVYVSIDGRNDMYGRELVLSAIAMLKDGPGTIARIDASGVNCVIADSRYQLVRTLTADPKWRLVGSDGVRTLLVRKAIQP
ncbi:MAG: hypothetical protein DLM58_10380 [Pseudonocardiales bacterium]|nr:MAG: hypothetical protein DLM58_10380 [Pseudonocardiales bacterium]